MTTMTGLGQRKRGPPERGLLFHGIYVSRRQCLSVGSMEEK